MNKRNLPKRFVTGKTKAGKNILTLFMTVGLLVGVHSLQFALMQNEKQSEPSPKTPIEEPADNSINRPGYAQENIFVEKYGNEYYYQCTPEYAKQLAENALIKVHHILTQKTTGTTPVGDHLEKGEDINNIKDFYPQYFMGNDEENILPLPLKVAFAESDLRICKTNGDPYISDKGAVGMMQLKQDAIDDINKWIKTTMEIDGVSYTLEEVSKDPQKAMEAGTFYLIMLCKNHAKEGCNNPILPYLNEEFSFKRQEELVLALYNNGYGNIMDYIKQGTIYDYLSEGPSTNYVNTIKSKGQRLAHTIYYNTDNVKG